MPLHHFASSPLPTAVKSMRCRVSSVPVCGRLSKLVFQRKKSSTASSKDNSLKFSPASRSFLTPSGVSGKLWRVPKRPHPPEMRFTFFPWHCDSGISNRVGQWVNNSTASMNQTNAVTGHNGLCLSNLSISRKPSANYIVRRATDCEKCFHPHHLLE